MYILEKIKEKLPAEAVFPPSEIKADLAIPAFKIDPKIIADKIAELKEPLILKTEIIGRYVNLYLDKEKLARKVLMEVKKNKDDYGKQKSTGKKIFIEYSSPNIAKPMHIGHLRNTIIGNSLTKIYQACGDKVIAANYIGDWGAQFGLLLLAWQKWGKLPITTEKISKLYAQIVMEVEKDIQLAGEVKLLAKKLEDNDPKLIQLWKKFSLVSLKDFKKIYKILGIKFDLWNGESFYRELAKKIVKEAVAKGIAKENGAVVVDLEKFGLKTYLLTKDDEVSLYSARDLAAAKWRLSAYKPEKLLYVTGHEQELYFKQIFKTLELLGYPAKKFTHVYYNLVNIAGKKASTRTGRVVLAQDIIDKAIKKTTDKKIGLGAIIYNLVSQKREKLLDFDWGKILNIKGTSAPYVQYEYVRAKNILKNKNWNFKFDEKKVVLNETESQLIMMIAKYPLIIREAKKMNEPYVIVNYLNGLAQEFSRFYSLYPVIKAGGPIREFRFFLVAAVAQVIKNGLALLGVEVPKKM